jgi:hypothetical protein
MTGRRALRVIKEIAASLTFLAMTRGRALEVIEGIAAPLSLPLK